MTGNVTFHINFEGRSGERGSGIYMLAAKHDDDDDDGYASGMEN